MAKNWEKYFPDHDVPRFLDFLVEEGVLKDMTSRRSEGPVFQMDGTRDTITVQHPLRSLREIDGDHGRYLVKTEEGNFDPDDLEEALLHLFAAEGDDEDGSEAWGEIESLHKHYARSIGRR